MASKNNYRVKGLGSQNHIKLVYNTRSETHTQQVQAHQEHNIQLTSTEQQINHIKEMKEIKMNYNNIFEHRSIDSKISIYLEVHF